MHNHASLIRHISVALTLGLVPLSSFGAEVGLKFTAQVTFALGSPFGISIPTGTVLSGHFVYESNTPSYALVAAGCDDCSAYDHKQINGLRVEFPGLTLQADEYIIQVKNNVAVTGFESADTLTVLFPDQSHGPNRRLGKSLLVNGSPVTAGGFRIELVAPATTFPDSQLPDTLDPSVFISMAGASTLGDGTPIPNSSDLVSKPLSASAFPHSTSDHDLDGDVDGADFLIWQRHTGTETGDGDADSSLFVDGTDLELWQAEYGMVELTSIAVPEPSALHLLFGALALYFTRR